MRTLWISNRVVTHDEIARVLLDSWRDRQKRQVADTPEGHCSAMADGVMELLRRRLT